MRGLAARLARMRANPVARRATRVAVAATLIVAAIYAVLAVVIVTVVDSRLTSGVDARLSNVLARVPFAGTPPPGTVIREPGGGPRFGTPLLAWTISTDGTQSRPAGEPLLPVELTHVGPPVTSSIGGTDVRLAGRGLGAGTQLVVAVSMDEVTHAHAQVVVAEVIVGPLLLGAVFLGALTIGSRVAGPVEQARRRQIEFTADASHELRTPLSVIEAQAQLALARERDPEWYRTAFLAVEAEGRRMRRLVDDLLWLARLDAHADAAVAEPVAVGVLAASAVERFGAVAEARQLRLVCESGGGDAAVRAPGEWLDRLLGVLLDNACKFTPAGGEVAVRVSATASSVRLEVEDSGPGIPSEERERVFTRFHRGGDGSGPGGSGLGLAIADAVIRATQGARELGASPAGGLSVAVTWPRAHGGAGRPVGRREGAPAPVPRGGNA